MFGYVRVRRDTLPDGALAGYEAVYCGLCRRMGERYGQFARLFLNYDFALLAMLLMPGGEPLCVDFRSCPRHPRRGRPFCTGGGWLDTAAGESVILTYWKLKDAAADDGFFKGLSARGLCALLAPAYQRARVDCPEFDSQAAERLKELRELEQEGCPSIDRTADCFARLLRAAAPLTGEEAQDRAMAELLYHIGRWIYLIDAVDDLSEDRRTGQYNPVAARFDGWTEMEQAYLRQIIDHSLSLAGAAFELLRPNACTAAVENIVYSGLPAVEELVFSGRWREDQKRHRRSSL